jgi:gliding motility-associated-like protein
MKTKAYIGKFPVIARSILVYVLLVCALSYQAVGQINPILEDADKITPFGNCDLLPTKDKPDYKLTVNNISQDITRITSYKINWGDGSADEVFPASFSSATHTYKSLGIFSLVFTASDNAGNIKSKTYSVSNQSNPAFGLSNIGGSTIGCAPLSLSFIIAGAADNAPGTYYEIDYGDGSPKEVKTLDQVIANNRIEHTYVKSSCEPPAINGQFTLKVKAINSCTSTQGSIDKIIVYKAPIAKFTTPNDNGCLGAPITFTNQTESGSGYNCSSSSDNYLWDFGDGKTSTEKNPTHQYTDPGKYNITLTSSNPQCLLGTTTAPKPICVSPQPVASFTLNSSVVCKATTVSVTNNSTTSNPCGNLQYTWTVDNYVGSKDCLPNTSSWNFDSGSDLHSANPSFIFNNAGTYQINLKVSNGCSVTKPVSKTITVKQVPSIKINTLSAICVGQAITPSAIANNCFGEVSSAYSWQFVGGEPSESAQFNPGQVVYNNAGTYQIRLLAINECGVSPAAPVALTVNDYPKPVISGPEVVCANSTGNVYTTTAGMKNYVWTVSSGGVITSGGTSTSNTITVDWKTSVNQFISLNYSQSACSAPAPTVLNVKINQAPEALICKPITVCSGDTVQIGASAKEGSSYSWVSVPAGFVSSLSNPFVSPSSTTEYILTESFATSGCSNKNSVKVTVNPLPNPVIEGPAAVCIGSKDIVYSTSAGMKNYQWTVSEGGVITAGGTSASNTVSVTWSKSDNQFLSLNYTNSNGCSAKVPTILHVSINESQTVSLIGPESVCEQATGVIYTALPGMKDYNWNITNDGKLISGGTSTSNVAEILWNKPGNQAVSINYTQPGCQAAMPAVINVAVNPRSLPTITGAISVCVGSKSLVYRTESGMANYKWEISAGGLITSGAASNEITVNWNGFGDQFVKVNYEGAALCPSVVPSVLKVAVNQLQVPTIKGETTTCQGLNEFEYVTESGMSNYMWKVSAGGTISSGVGTNRISVIWKSSGDQSVSIGYSNASGCSSSDEGKMTVKVNPAPVFTVTPELQEICSGSLTTIKLSPSNGTITYKWSPEVISGTVTGAVNGSGSTIVQQLINTATSVGTVRYTIIASNGTCSATPIFADVKVRNLNPTISGLNNSCVKTKGVAYTTESGMTDYNWVVSSGGTITSGAGTNSITVDWSIVGNQTVGISYSNKNGCTGNSVATYNVKVNPLPTITIASPSVVCAGSAVTFTTENGMSNYQWHADQGAVVSEVANSSNAVNVLWNEPGAHLLTLNYTNSFGCTAISPLVSEIAVLPIPTPIISGPQNVCANAGGTLYSTQPGKANYSWSIVGGQIISGGKSTSSSSTVVWENTGTHSISVNYSNGECMAPQSTTLQVNVNTTPTFTASEISGCTPLSVTFKNTTSFGADSYTWDFNDGTKYTTTDPEEMVTHLFINGLAKTKTFVVKLSSTSASGCTVTSEKSITVEPSYSVGYPIARKGCEPFEVKFQNAYSGSKSYSWQIEGGAILSNEINPNLSFRSIDGKETSYVVNLIGESTKGCRDTVKSTIQVFAKPKAAFTASATEGCSPLTVKFNNGSSEAKTYRWDFGDGSATVSLTSPENIFIAPEGKEELYNVRLLARNEIGCVDTFKTIVKVLPTPQADFSVDPLTQTMPARKVALTNLTQFGPWHYEWKMGDQSIAKSGNISEYVFPKAGYYIVSLTAKGDVCASTKRIGITINDGAPTTSFDCDSVGCAPFSIKFKNNSINGFRYSWDFGDGNHSTEYEPKITYFSGGTYKVRLEVYNSIGEMTVAEKVIMVHDQPKAFFKASVNRLKIPGNSVSFVNLSENANTLVWDFGDGNTSTDFQPQYEYLKTGVFNVSLTVTTADNCSDKFELLQGIEIFSDEMKLANAFIPSKEGPSGGSYITGDPRNHIFHPVLATGDVVEYQLQIFNRWGNLFFQSSEVERGWDGYFNGRLCPQDVYVWKIRCKFSNGSLITKIGDVTLIQ